MADASRSSKTPRASPRAPFFVWKKAFGVGAPEVDADHRHFFEIANVLHAAIAAGEGEVRVREALALMNEHARDHFAGEERSLAASACPFLPQHLAQHRQFLVDLTLIRAHPSPSAERAFALARDWIVEHILGLDRRHGPWLVRAGAR